MPHYHLRFFLSTLWRWPQEDCPIEIVELSGSKNPTYLPEEEIIIQADTEYEVTPVLSETSVEEYSYLTTDGETENRTEEPYFNFYTEGGRFNRPFSVYPYNAVTWTSPSAPFNGRIIVTVRDRRGGMAWNWLSVKVTE